MVDDTPSEVDAMLERWRLADLLERLPAEEALTLRLRFYEELSQSEIADRTGIALGTVKSRMVAGLARLRTMLIEEGAR
jgi:RNA polymerase sigma-70 factor (ECF subfamily)